MSTSSHEFSPPQLESGDVRSPCPALNALANHSYLPHDGKNISIPTAIRALQAGYNLSWPLAFILALGACILCSKRLSGFDLSDLQLHNAIEHDGSLSRSDTPAGSKLAPIAPDAERLASLLGSGEDLTLDDLAAVRRARDKALIAPLSAMHNRIAVGEIALAYSMFRNAQTGKVQVQHFRTWFGGDRLPEEWTPPAVQQGLFATRAVSQEVAKKVAVLAKSE